MSAAFETESESPTRMTVWRDGSNITAAPPDIANRPFLAQMLLSSSLEGDMTAMRVFMESGTMTNWHSHPRGQLLFVVSGVGHVQRHGEAAECVRAGDTVWFAAGERHRHGAASDSSFSYLSVQCVRDGTAVRWLDTAESEEADQ